MKLLSLVLVALFGMPTVSPLFALAAKTDVMVRLCCRKGAVHHCAGMAGMSGMDAMGSPGDRPQVSAVEGCCPCCPATVTAAHFDGFTLPSRSAIYTSPVSQAARVAQTESLWRIARDRSRQKRGPPSMRLS
jgi:hypothetical protein